MRQYNWRVHTEISAPSRVRRRPQIARLIRYRGWIVQITGFESLSVAQIIVWFALFNSIVVGRTRFQACCPPNDTTRISPQLFFFVVILPETLRTWGLNIHTGEDLVFSFLAFLSIPGWVVFFSLCLLFFVCVFPCLVIIPRSIKSTPIRAKSPFS